MITPTGQRIWLYNRPADMRKQFDGLAALAQIEMGERVIYGDGFVFINRRRTLMKVLYFESAGLCLWAKRLEKGPYPQLDQSGRKLALRPAELLCLIDGISLQKRRKNTRFGN